MTIKNPSRMISKSVRMGDHKRTIFETSCTGSFSRIWKISDDDIICIQL